MSVIYLTVVTCVMVQMYLHAEGGIKHCHRCLPLKTSVSNSMGGGLNLAV